MRRRDFLAAPAVGVLAVSWRKIAIAETGGAGKGRIGYIRSQIPDVAIPACNGAHYAERIRDTLDLAERGRLALNALTSISDPEADYEIYLHLSMFNNPPTMIHDFSDWCQPGRVDVKVKRPLQTTLLRVPEWVKEQSDGLTCLVNRKPAKLEWADRYIRLGPLAVEDRVTIRFPIHERTERLTVLGVDCTLIVRGNTVVAIDPPGRIRPLYQRAACRKKEVSWREVPRFLANETIAW